MKSRKQDMRSEELTYIVNVLQGWSEWNISDFWTTLYLFIYLFTYLDL